MSLERTAAAVAALSGTVGAGIAATLLGARYADDPAVLIGVGFGAAVGAVLSAGMFAVAYAADTDGNRPYLSPAATASASVLLVAATDVGATAANPPLVSIALVGGALLMIVGSALVFVAEFRGV